MKLGSKTYLITATVLRVVDGDTLECEVDCLFDIKTKITVRMYGINTPEIHSRSMPERVKANQAKDWLKAKVEGKIVYLKTYKDKEKFGRYLAEVFMEDPSGKETLEPSINQAMVVLNLGVEYFGGKR